MQNIQYSKNSDENSDNIYDLPTNRNQPSHNELKIVDSIFKKHSNTLNNITKEFKDGIIFGILFFLFSLPQFDELLKKYISVTQKSLYILLLIKALFFIVIIWIIKNRKLLLKE